MTHIRNDDSKLWVECVVHLANGSFVTPEGVVVLTVLGIRVADCGEHLVPRCGIGVCLRHAVWRLPTNQSKRLMFVDCRHGTLHIMLVIMAVTAEKCCRIYWFIYTILCIYLLIIYVIMSYYLILAILQFNIEHYLSKQVEQKWQERKGPNPSKSEIRVCIIIK